MSGHTVQLALGQSASASYACGVSPIGRFDAEWRKRCSIRHASPAEIVPMVQLHYLRRPPGVTVCRLVMDCDGSPVGMVIFAMPPRETAKRYGGISWELARLWIADDIPSNAESWLISQAVRHVRQWHPDVAVLVSYADPSVGHQGTIYKAANWVIDGRTDDDRKSPRVDYYWQERKFSRRAHLPAGVTPLRVPRVSKHRFIYRIGGNS